jgi:hypothetical protein
LRLLGVFRRHTFRSQLSMADFRERLDRSLVKRIGFFGAFQGRVYGTVSNDRFELWTPGSTRGHVAGVIGRIDLAVEPASGSLRLLPEPLTLVPLVMIVALAIASQFLATFWVRLGLPSVALLAIAVFVWQTGVEWQLLRQHLQTTVQVDID